MEKLFQLMTARLLLTEIAGSTDQSLVATANDLLDDVATMMRTITQAHDQAKAALALPDELRAMRDAVADLSDRISRRYFAVLPTLRSIGLDAPARASRGAA